MLTGKRWFSTLDLASGYWQVSLSPEARCKTAFATHSGLFQFKVMPFRLCNSLVSFLGLQTEFPILVSDLNSDAIIGTDTLGSTHFGRFERLMDQVLQGLRWSRCLVYLDDIISFGSTFEDALDNLTLIFERLRAYGLQLRNRRSVICSGLRCPSWAISSAGGDWNVTPRRSRMSWPIGDCLKSVWQFLRFMGYYRRFVPGFADLVEPLVALTGKDVRIVHDIIH